LKEAVRFASVGASMSTRSLGAQTGIPTFEEIESYIERN
jgi:sugar/nucleoside kinase (ribokinase family)